MREVLLTAKDMVLLVLLYFHVLDLKNLVFGKISKC